MRENIDTPYLKGLIFMIYKAFVKLNNKKKQ